jgi:XTP/dITP diphosphohydrolase
MLQVVLATSNAHKIAELEEVFREVRLNDVRLLSLKEAAKGKVLTEPAETGKTFRENAIIKAMGYAAQTEMLCLADDSGLEVEALGGKPGVISSHYSTDGRETGLSREQRDAANNQRLLRELEGVPDEKRGARFVCVMALAQPLKKAIVYTCEGRFEGRIGMPPRVPAGKDGFGYDPLFLVGPQHAQTSAELPPKRKNELSHRGQAARDMAAYLWEYLSKKR